MTFCDFFLRLSYRKASVLNTSRNYWLKVDIFASFEKLFWFNLIFDAPLKKPCVYLRKIHSFLQSCKCGCDGCARGRYFRKVWLPASMGPCAVGGSEDCCLSSGGARVGCLVDYRLIHFFVVKSWTAFLCIVCVQSLVFVYFFDKLIVLWLLENTLTYTRL